MTKQENIAWMKQFGESVKDLPSKERMEKIRARFKKFNETLQYVKSLGYVPIPNGLGAAERGEFRYFFALPFRPGYEHYKIVGWINADNSITFLDKEA